MTSRLAAAIAVAMLASATIGNAQSASQAQDQAYKPGNGVTNPTLVSQIQPKYTSDAIRQRIEGAVELQAIILQDGTVGDVRVLKSLDAVYGLDQQAVIAAKQWRFRPGTLNGQAVATIVTFILEFKLKNGPAPTGSLASTLAAVGQANPAKAEQPEDEFLKDTYPELTANLVKPKLLKQVPPKYNSAAMRAKVQGMVTVEAVVMPDGTVGRARVIGSLDKTFGLDDEAIAAVLQWGFEPGQLDGKAVPVVVRLMLEFRLR
jgi:TonB family protein